MLTGCWHHATAQELKQRLDHSSSSPAGHQSACNVYVRVCMQREIHAKTLNSFAANKCGQNMCGLEGLTSKLGPIPETYPGPLLASIFVYCPSWLPRKSKSVTVREFCRSASVPEEYFVHEPLKNHLDNWCRVPVDLG